MRKVILLIAVVAATTLTTFAFAEQANHYTTANNELTGDEYVKIEFKDLSAETQILLVKVFEGYDIKTVFQNVETKLLKVVVVKDDVERTFIQIEEGKFVEQE